MRNINSNFLQNLSASCSKMYSCVRLLLVGSVFPEQNVNSGLHGAFLRETLIPFCTERFVVSMKYPPKILLGHTIAILFTGSAVAQAVRRWLPTATASIRVCTCIWELWWTKRHWGRFSPSTSVSLTNHHFTNSSIIIISRGCHNRPIGDHNAPLY
jgi:hypothetical protein